MHLSKHGHLGWVTVTVYGSVLAGSHCNFNNLETPLKKTEPSMGVAYVLVEVHWGDQKRTFDQVPLLQAPSTLSLPDVRQGLGRTCDFERPSAPFYAAHL